MAVKINARLTSSTSVLGNNGNGRLALRPGQLNLYANRDKTPSGVTVAPAISGVNPFAFIPANSYAVLPGIDNYLNSAGTTAANIDGLVGRANDWGGLGPELVAISGATGGVTAAGSMIAALSSSVAITSGKAYRFDYTITACVGQLSTSIGTVVNGTAQAINFTGRFSETLVATTTGTLSVGLASRGPGVTSVTGSVSVREVIGIHATQATTGNKPTLRRESNLTYLQFDGTTDYLSLSAVPFQMADDHWVVVCVKHPSGAASEKIFTIRGAVANPLIEMIVDSVGRYTAQYRDDAGVIVARGSTNTNTNTVVVSMRQVSRTAELRTNGVRDGATFSTAGLGTTTLTNASVGAAVVSVTPQGFLTGTIYAVIYGKGTISDADLAAVERYAAGLGGIAI